MNEEGPGSIREDRKKEGYSPEEEYFYRLNRELIEQRRKELDEHRQRMQLEKAKTAHWMKCPKCGSQMSETDLSGIRVDQCSHCQGVYFDYGELELFIEARMPKHRLKTLLKTIEDKLLKGDTAWRP